MAHARASRAGGQVGEEGTPLLLWRKAGWKALDTDPAELLCCAAAELWVLSEERECDQWKGSGKAKK